MNKLIEFFQRNKLLTHYLAILIIISGAYSFYKLRREARPNVNFHRVSVQVSYPGASPSDIEELVVDPIEQKIQEVDGVEEFKSISYAGSGFIYITIDDTYPDPQKISDELQRKIAETSNLPEGAKDPVVTEVKTTNIPVLGIVLYGSKDPLAMKLETEKLKDFLQSQKGVQSASYRGISKLQLQALLSRRQLNKFDLTLGEVLSKVSAWAKQKPGGLLETKKTVANLTIGSGLKDAASLKNFVIRSNDSNKKVKLSDVSEIKFAVQKTQTEDIFEDKNAIMFTVVKKPFSDAITVAETVKQSMKTYMKGVDKDLKTKFFRDESIRIKNGLRSVFYNAVGGLILVILILLLSLDWRSAVVTGIGLPIAIFGGVALLYLIGQTLNSLVIIGAVIVMGMLVDDAIVVCENIYSYLERGFSPKEAAFRGASEIALPVIASVLTTVFAFLPLIFIEGIMGDFIKVIPITVTAMLLVSLVEALTILPVHAEEMMKPKTAQTQVNKKKIKPKGRATQFYKKYILWSIRWRWAVLGVFVAFLSLSVFLGVSIFKRFTLFPAEGVTGLSIRLELKRNSPMGATKQIAKELSRKLINISEDTFDSIYSSIGTSGERGTRGSHLGIVNITFTSDQSFFKKEKRVIKKIEDLTKEFAVEKNIKTYTNIRRPGPPIGKPVEFNIVSRDFDLGLKVSGWLKSELEKIKGVHSVGTDLDGESLRYRFDIDNEKAVSQGVDPKKISQTIFAASSGVIASEILKNNEKIDILISLQEKDKTSAKDILNLKVRNSNGQAVYLRSFVSLVEERGPASIQRTNGLRTITLSGEVNENLNSAAKVNQKIRPFIKKISDKYKSVQIDIGGGERDRLRTLSDALKLYFIAIFLIFVTISLTFKSIIYPFLVLTVIPMGISGVIWALLLHGKGLSFMGLIGLVGLSGVVVNVAIIFLKFVQNRIADNYEFHEAIADAGASRLRAITITTFSTLIGLAPTMYSIAGKDIFSRDIALVLGWGLLVATLLTLLFLPSMLSFFTVLARKR